MFSFSYGDWFKSIQDENAMPVITIPTDLDTEGCVGSNEVDNSWLVVLANKEIEKEKRPYFVFSVDKAVAGLPKGMTLLEANLAIQALWKKDPTIFAQQHFLSVIYNLYRSNENILNFLEEFFRRMAEHKQ